MVSNPPIPGAPGRIPGEPASVPSGGDLRAPSSVQLRDMNGRFVKGGFGWEWTRLQEFMNMPEIAGAAWLDAAKEHMQELAAEIQDYAQQNAPWQDQTGDARRGLKAIFIPRRDVFEIDLGHSVSYGYYLENHNGGEYAIVQPTLREFAPQMLEISGSGHFGHSQLGGGFE